MYDYNICHCPFDRKFSSKEGHQKIRYVQICDPTRANEAL